LDLISVARPADAGMRCLKAGPVALSGRWRHVFSGMVARERPLIPRYRASAAEMTRLEPWTAPASGPARFANRPRRPLFEDRTKTLYGLAAIPMARVETGDERCYHQWPCFIGY
jgi:hypothetical protein